MKVNINISQTHETRNEYGTPKQVTEDLVAMGEHSVEMSPEVAAAMLRGLADKISKQSANKYPVAIKGYTDDITSGQIRFQ